MTKTLRRWPPIAAGVGLLVLYGIGAVHVMADHHSRWLVLVLAAQAAALLLFGGLLWRQIAAFRRAQRSLQIANEELKVAQASLQTSNNARRATQAALRRSEQRFRMVFENMRNIIVCMGAKGSDVFDYGRDGTLLFGADVGRIAGMRQATTGRAEAGRWYDALHPDDLPAYLDAERRRRERGEPYNLTYRFFHPETRELRWASETAWATADAESGETYLDSYILDITAQKTLEAQLRESRAILESVINNIPLTVSITDRERRIVLLNKAIEDLYGVRQADVVGRVVDDFRPARYRTDTAVRDHFRVIETGEPVRGQTDHYGTDGGQEVWITNLVPIRDERGVVRHVLRTTMEVPQLARANQALAENRALLIEAQRRAKLAYWSWKAGDGSINTWSDNAAEVLGIAPDPAPGADDAYRALIHADDRPAAAKAHHDLYYAGRAFAIDYRVRRRDGGLGWIRETGDVELDAHGVPLRQHGTIQDITDQKRAEEALRLSEARLRGFMDHAPLLMYLKDPEGRYQLVNREFENAEAKAADAMCGRTAEELYPPALAQIFRQEDNDVIAAGAPIVREYAERRFGRDQHFMVVKFPIRDETGAIIGIGGFNQDVTERKAAEQALRDSEARLRAFMDNAPVGMMVKDAQGTVLSINRLGATFLGRRPEEVVGRQTSEFTSSGTASVVAAHEQTVLRRGIAVERELHFPDRPELEWTYEVKFPIRDARGATLGLGAIVMNITDRKRAEAARQESEALLRSFMENSPVAMSIKSPDGRFLMVNRWIKLMMGLTTDQIIGKATTELSRSAGAGVTRDIELEVLRTGQTVEREVHFEDRATFDWTHEVKFPIRDGEGNIVAVGGVAIDIADRKRAELALRKSEARLLEAQRRAKLAYWHWSNDTDTHEWSPEAANVLGRPGAVLPNRDEQYLEFVHPEDRAMLDRMYSDYMTRPAPYTIDYRILRADGTVGWIRELAEPEFDDGAIRAVGTIQDVSDQKQAEEALRESQALLLAAQRRAKIAFWTSGVNSSDEFAPSDHAADVLGIPPEEMPRDDAAYLRFVHPEDRTRAANAFHRQLALREPYAIEYRVIRSDGSIGWIRDLAELQFGADGQPMRVIGTIQDITEQRMATEALRDSEARLRAFFDNAPFTMYLKDTDLRYRMVNRELERVEGKSAAEICGRAASEIYPPQLASRYIAEDQQVIETGRALVTEYDDPGLPFHSESLQVKFPIRDGAGRIVAIGGITQDVSEWRRAERALRESEARMRAFMDHVPVIMHVKDVQGRYQLVNREFERVEGRPLAAVLGRTAFDVLPRDVAEAVAASDLVVAEEGRTVTHEYSVPSRSTYRDRLTLKFPIRGSAGEIIGIGAFTQDITERKEAEQALAESEARRREAQRRAKLAYWYWSRQTDDYEWSSEAAIVLGIPEDRLPERRGDYLALVHAEDRDLLARVDQTMVSAPAPYAVEYRIVRPGGSMAWIRELAEAELDAAGQIVRVVGTLQDITDQKLAEEAVRQSESQLRRAQQQARLAYWRWQFGADGATDRYEWSPGSGQLFDVADTDMPTSSTAAKIVVHPDDYARMRRLYNDVRAGLDAYVMEYRIVRPDGMVVWVRESGEVVRTADGQRIAVEGTLQDITEQRALQDQLQQALKIEALGQLTGGIAHDFNNLLAIVLGNLELLREELHGEKSSAQRVETAVRATLRGADLTKRLLAFARRQPLAPKLTQVNDLIRSMKDLLARPLGPTIAIDLDLTADLGLAEIDPAQLETSLLNLVVNARDAMPEGGRLKVRTADARLEPGEDGVPPETKSGDYVLISVTDSGSGMAPEVKARAFDPFFTTKGVGQGTGLGLSMVYGFVKQSGGHVQLDSEPGRGTTVRLFLPCAGRAELQAPAVADAPSGGSRRTA